MPPCAATSPSSWRVVVAGPEPERLAGDTDFFRKVKPVNYVDVLESANVFTDTTEVQVRKRLYTKLTKYESEDEFRALFEGGAGQQISFKPEALVEVKSGSAMNRADRGHLDVLLWRRLDRV